MMERLTTIAATRRWRRGLAGRVGFVPTMGALHEGHLALVRRARADCDQVIASIFVNPLQFGPAEDFDHYPRDEAADCALLAAEGVDAVVLPARDEIYPPGFATSVVVAGPLTERLEAAARPGHFTGVTTVVCKLLQITTPTHAYFGMKDAQQLLVIGQLVRDLAIPTAIVPIPTVREPDGVAMSSRNRYLAPAARAAARAIPRGLDLAVARYGDGERAGAALCAIVRRELQREGAAETEYVSCAALDDLTELDRVDQPALLSLAARLGKTRLIDNRWLGCEHGLPPTALFPPA